MKKGKSLNSQFAWLLVILAILAAPSLVRASSEQQASLLPSGVWAFDPERTAVELRKTYDENIVQIGLLAMKDAFITFGPDPNQITLMGDPGSITGTCNYEAQPDGRLALSACRDDRNELREVKELGSPQVFSDGTLVIHGAGGAVLWYKKLIVE